MNVVVRVNRQQRLVWLERITYLDVRRFAIAAEAAFGAVGKPEDDVEVVEPNLPPLTVAPPGVVTATLTWREDGSGGPPRAPRPRLPPAEIQ